ncbi:MAG TPA: NAD(P)/FAD-dependent oxidoreductase [Thermoleophilaceae bacterium]
MTTTLTRDHSPPHPDGGQVVIVGAGPGGLSVAWAFERAGVPALILERGDRVGASWHGYYDCLRLNTARWISSLPGLVMPRRYGRYVRRDDVIEYLEEYASRLKTPIEFGTEVQRIERQGESWKVRTEGGSIDAPAVVVATGLNATLHMPDWPGRDGFAKELVHARDYRNAEPYRGRDVLVVGTGASSIDISLDLLAHGAGRVRVAVRTPPVIAPTQVLGMPLSWTTWMLKHVPLPRGISYPLLDRGSLLLQRVRFGDLSEYGLPMPPEGIATAYDRRGHGATIDHSGWTKAVKRGDVEIVAALTGFEGSDVLLADGTRIRPEVVIATTGQRTNLPALLADHAPLRADGRPRVHGGTTHPGAPALHFIGYRTPPAQLTDMRADARAIARRVTRELEIRSRAPAQRRSTAPQPA